uniref:Regulator of chromosome condensation n=1 Tax=Panagrolaimus superbus TaxID=310955 RepID=A0A914XV55_9BILA
MSATESMEVDQQSARVEDEQEVSDTNELIVEEDLNATAEQVEQAEKEKDEPINPPSENEDEEMKEDGEKNEDKEVKMEGIEKKVDKEELPSAPENDEDDEEEEERPKPSRPSRNVKKAPAKKEETKKPPARTRGKAKEAPPAKVSTKAKPEPKKKAASPAKKSTPLKKIEAKKEASPEPVAKGGRKRKISAVENGTPVTTIVKKHKSAKDIHLYTDFVNQIPGDRILSCGEGEQIGHPGRTTTRKPRAIGTLPDDVKILQVVAGGVHTTILTDKYEVYSCGINEGGTVPVKDLAAEETKDELTIIEFTDEVKKEGNIVQLTSGAGFTAALTDLGSVIAWGNLRDENGAVEVHHLFAEMKKGPTVIIHHNNVQIVKIAAGENHLVMLSSEGEIYTFGEGSHGQLGGSARTKHIRSTYMADDTGKSLHRSVLEKSKFVKFSNIFAGGYWTMARSMDGRIFACGLNNYGQLGFALPEEETNGTEEGEAEDLEEQNKKLKIDRLTYSPAFPSDKIWTHIAGVKHIVARTDEGEVYGIGLNTDNELGIGTYKGKDDKEHWRYFELQKISFPADLKIAGITATLGCSIAWTDDGIAFGFGYDSVGQLGLGNTDDEDKCVVTPRKITSAHLDDYKIISVNIADNHSVFLATKNGE